MTNKIKSDCCQYALMKRLMKVAVAAVLISILSTTAVMLYTSTEHTLPGLLAVRPIYLLIAVALHFMSYGIWGYRTSTLCRSLDIPVTTLKSTEIVTSSLLMMSLTPSSIGGEPAMIYLLTREGVTPGKASAIVVAGRVFDAILILLSLPFALVILKSVSSGLDTVLTAAALMITVVIVFIFIIILNHAWFLSNAIKIVQKLLCHIGLGRIADAAARKIREEAVEFRNSFAICARNRRSDMLVVFGATLLYWSVEFMHIPLILYGLDLSNAGSLIPVAFAAQIVLVLIMVIPITPGSSGLAEVSSAALLSTFIPLHLVGIVVICWRAVTYYLNVIVGSFVSIKVVKDMDFIWRVLE